MYLCSGRRMVYQAVQALDKNFSAKMSEIRTKTSVSSPVCNLAFQDILRPFQDCPRDGRTYVVETRRARWITSALHSYACADGFACCERGSTTAARKEKYGIDGLP